MTRLLFQTITIISLFNACKGSTFCSGGKLAETDINDQILATINNHRSRLTKGEQPNGFNNGLLPSGKNMNKLSWSCQLEEEAIKAAGDTCPEMPASTPTDKALIYMSYEDYGEPLSTIITSILEGINGVPLTDIMNDVKFSDEPLLKDYANLMRATTTQIGCSMNRCSDTQRYSFYCLTNQPPIKAGEVIYQRGTTTTTGCTCEQAGHVCDKDGFCVPESTTSTTTTTTTTTTASASAATVPTGGTNSMCTMNVGMIDSLRTKFLDMHNYRRSLLAMGKCAKNNGNLLPAAQNMAKMRYNCDLEADALTLAKQCPQSGNGGGMYGENFYRSTGFTTFENGVHKAVTSWWKVVRQHAGIGMKAMFRTHHVGAPIASFTQMAWATSRDLGCSIVQCASDYVAVCRYMEKGNIVERNVYIPGTMCAMCSGMCNMAEGLCP